MQSTRVLFLIAAFLLTQPVVAQDPFETGTFSAFFQRICNGAQLECIPSFPFPSGEFFGANDFGIDGKVSVSIPGRAFGSVGYAGNAVTPKISTYIITGIQDGNPDLSQRITGVHWGVQRYTLTQDNPTIDGTFTFSQSGGIYNRSNPQVGDDISFGVFGQVGFFAFQTASGVIDPTECSFGPNLQSVLFCILDSQYDPNIQIATFANPTGSADPDVPTDPVAAGSVDATFQIAGTVGDTFFVGAFIGFMGGRHGGFADSQSTLQLEIDPNAVIPTFEDETFQPAPLLTEIDIMPSDDPNNIDPRSKGVIPVAILTTNIANGDRVDFDAAQVDPASVEFGPSGANEAHARGHVTDVDGDGDTDLMLHFKTQQTGIVCGDAEAVLMGKTFEGEDIVAVNAITTIGCP